MSLLFLKDRLAVNAVPPRVRPIDGIIASRAVVLRRRITEINIKGLQTRGIAGELVYFLGNVLAFIFICEFSPKKFQIFSAVIGYEANESARKRNGNSDKELIHKHN